MEIALVLIIGAFIVHPGWAVGAVVLFSLYAVATTETAPEAVTEAQHARNQARLSGELLATGAKFAISCGVVLTLAKLFL